MQRSGSRPGNTGAKPTGSPSAVPPLGADASHSAANPSPSLSQKPTASVSASTGAKPAISDSPLNNNIQQDPAESLIADESRLHREACANVRLKAQRLKHAIQSDHCDDALFAAADIAYELKPGTPAAALSPKLYYDVYLLVTSELRMLEAYLYELARSGMQIYQLYEKVQATSAVLPRLYMLITVGSVYIKSGQALAGVVLKDLAEMCLAVQHSMRGLFLRAYLTQEMKDKLPDYDEKGAPRIATGTNNMGSLPESFALPERPSESSKHDDTNEGILFLLQNFGEMNRLWVRMQYDSYPLRLEHRAKERKELRLLVGTNLSVLSRMNCLTPDTYSKQVLPRLIDQIVSCADATAQEYLADCIIQVFPDEYQLQTLGAFLTMCSQLAPGVNMRSIISSLTNRLSKFATSSESNLFIASRAHAFEAFRQHLPRIIEKNAESLRLADLLGIHLSLLQYVLKAHPMKIEYVDDVFGFCLTTLNNFKLSFQAKVIRVAPSGVGPTNAEESPYDQPIFQHGIVMSKRAFDSATSNPLGFRFPGNQQGPKAGADGAGAGSGAEITMYHMQEFSQEETIVFQILTGPLGTFKSLPLLLQFNNFIPVRTFLCLKTQQRVATAVLTCQSPFVQCISSVPQLHKLFDFVGPLLETEEDQSNAIKDPDGADPDEARVFHPYLFPHPESFSNSAASKKKRAEAAELLAQKSAHVEECEHMIAKIIYLINAPNSAFRFEMYQTFRSRIRVSSQLGWGTLTESTLIHACLNLALKEKFDLQSGQRSSHPHQDAYSSVTSMPTEEYSLLDPAAIFNFVTELLVELSMLNEELAVQFYCQAAICASQCSRLDKRPLVLEYLSNALSLFEISRSISSSTLQFSVLMTMIGALRQVYDLKGLAKDSYLTLSNRMVKYSFNLLTRPEQVLALCSCCTLFWVPSLMQDETMGLRLSDQVMNLIDSAISSARRCLSHGEKVLSLLDILNRCVYLLEQGCSMIHERGRTVALIDEIKDSLDKQVKKSSAVYKVAVSRLGRAISCMRRKPEVFPGVPDLSL